MTLYLLDLICFGKIHRQRFAFSIAPLGPWEEQIHILSVWRITGAEDARIVPGFGLLLPGHGVFAPEAFKLAVEARTVPGSLSEIAHHGTQTEI